MTKKEYLRELKDRLSHLPREEREEALKYYEEYFEEAGDKTVEEIIDELGTPEEVAEKILADFNQEPGTSSEYEYRSQEVKQNVQKKSKMSKVLKIVLIIFICIIVLMVIAVIAGFSMFKSIAIHTIDNVGMISSQVIDHENDFLEAEDIFQKTISVGENQDGEINLSEKKFDSIELSDIASSFEVVQGSEWKLNYHLENPEQLEIAVKPDDGSNVLQIRYPLTKEDQDRNRDEKIVLTIPKENKLRSFDIERCLGKMNLAGISSWEFDLEGNLGEINLSDLTAEKSISISQSLGKVDVKRIKTANLEIGSNVGKITGEEISVSQVLEIEESLGEVELRGSFPCNMEIEENIGKIKLEVTGATEQDYNYRVVESLGGYQIGEFSSKTIGSSFERNNQSLKNILIKGNMGNVAISFR